MIIYPRSQYGLKLKLNNYGYIIIGSIYRPPNSPVSYHDYIINDLDFISSFNYELIIMGDLNMICYDKHNQSYVYNAKIKTLEIMYQLMSQDLNHTLL